MIAISILSSAGATTRAIASSCLSLGLLCAAVAAPALITRHTHPLPAFYQEWLAFALSLAALVPLMLHPGIRELRLPRIALVPVLLIGVLIAQVLLARIAYVEQALIACVYLLWAVALLWCARMLRDTLGEARVCEILAFGIAIVAFASALLAILRHLDIVAVPGILLTPRIGERAYANLTQPNLFANYLCLGLASLLLLRARQRLTTMATCLLAAPILLALAFTQSRCAWAFLGLVLAVSLWLRCKRAIIATKFPYVELSLVFLLGLLCAYCIAPLLDRADAGVGARMFRTADGVTARFELWREAWNIFLAAPWLGAGFGQFAITRFSAASDPAVHAALGLFTHTHNIVMQLLAEFGLIATLPILWFGARWLGAQLKAPPTMESAWILMLIGIIALHSLVEFPLWYANFLLIALLVLGLGEQAPMLHGHRFGSARLGVIALLGAVTLATSFAAYRGVERLFVGPHGDSVPSVLVRESHALETRSIFLPFIELAYSGLLRIDGVDARDALAINSRVMRFMPDDHVVYRQTLLLAQAGEAAQAQDVLRKSIAAYPDFVSRYASVLESLAAERPAVFEPLRAVVRERARP